MCYFAFMPAFAVSITSLIPLFIARALFFEESAGLMVIQFFFLVAIQASTLLLIHLVVTKAGQQMTELKLHMKNDLQVGGLGDGVVIADEKTSKIVFYNADAVLFAQGSTG